MLSALKGIFMGSGKENGYHNTSDLENGGGDSNDDHSIELDQDSEQPHKGKNELLDEIEGMFGWGNEHDYNQDTLFVLCKNIKASAGVFRGLLNLHPVIKDHVFEMDILSANVFMSGDFKYVKNPKDQRLKTVCVFETERTESLISFMLFLKKRKLSENHCLSLIVSSVDCENDEEMRAFSQIADHFINENSLTESFQRSSIRDNWCDSADPTLRAVFNSILSFVSMKNK